MMRSAQPRLSALVVCHNEEEQLAACLDTLAFADELVVVLDRCTDGSRAIAERYTDKIIEGAWPIEGDRRNAGNAACHGDWILEIDCDERVPPALAEEIRRVVAEAAPPGYFQIPVDNYVGSRLIRHGWGAAFGVGSVARLASAGIKTWGRQRIHPSIRFVGERLGRLENRLVHYVDEDISDLIARLNRYSTARAADLRQSGEIGTFGRNLRRVATRFWKCFVSRKGYREGYWGFLIALMAGLYPLLSHLKARLEDD